MTVELLDLEQLAATPTSRLPGWSIRPSELRADLAAAGMDPHQVRRRHLDACPECGHPAGVNLVDVWPGRLSFDCPAGCHPGDVHGAIAARRLRLSWLQWAQRRLEQVIA